MHGFINYVTDDYFLTILKIYKFFKKLFCTTDLCTSGDVHLVGGYTSTEGRLEMCINGSWTLYYGLCSSWDTNTANVWKHSTRIDNIYHSSCNITILFWHISLCPYGVGQGHW